MESFTDIYREIEDDVSMRWLSYNLTEHEMKTWSKNHTRFEVSIYYKDEEITVDFYSNGVPMDEDVISSLVIDAVSSQEETFDNFCDAYGFDNDSISALKTYEACKTNAQKLKSLFGDAVYQRFINCET